MKTSDSIKSIMRELIESYSVLQVLLQKERLCLVNLNVSEIEGLLKEKDTVVMRLKLLEAERKRLLRRYYLENGIDGEVDQSILFKLDDDEVFESLRLQLISLIQSISELNEFNKILIERTNLFLKNSINVFENSTVNIPSIAKSKTLSLEA
ncbi:MAG: flagellar protein FlgN [Thermodesulfovibrionales bacterium]|nr:flagellar protein FlgN [Thermodesulfovibrionales bacterium]